MESYVIKFVKKHPESRDEILKLADRAYRIGYPILEDEVYDELLGDDQVDIDDNPEADGVAVDLYPPMLSQSKTYNYSDLSKFGMNVMTASLKLDGFAVSLVYRKGVFSYATTRGDGRQGLTITNHILAGVFNIPWTIDNDSEKLEIRGEMVLDKSHGDAKHNPRSICVGLFGRNDLSEIEEYAPHFFAYDMLDHTESHADRLMALGVLGFDVVPWRILRKYGALALQSAIEELVDYRDKFNYECDGIVFRVNDQETFESFGTTKHHPKGSIAFKFKTETTLTKVISVEWSEGEKTGKLTPIVHIQPVFLNGAEIRKINGGTIGSTLEPGDWIQVTRKGGVIPVIIAKLEGGC